MVVVRELGFFFWGGLKEKGEKIEGEEQKERQWVN